MRCRKIGIQRTIESSIFLRIAEITLWTEQSSGDLLIFLNQPTSDNHLPIDGSLIVQSISTNQRMLRAIVENKCWFAESFHASAIDPNKLVCVCIVILKILKLVEEDMRAILALFMKYGNAKAITNCTDDPCEVNIFSEGFVDSFSVTSIIALIEEEYDYSFTSKQLQGDEIRTIIGMINILKREIKV